MNRRIKTIGTFNERKKNVHDPLVNPSKFFRTTGDEKGVSIKKFSQKLKGHGESNAKVTNLYGQEIESKKKEIDAKKKSALKQRKTEGSENLFGQEEELKGTQALPAGAKFPDGDLSKEEREMYDMMKDGSAEQFDVISRADEKYNLDFDKNKIPLIKFKQTLQGGWPEKFKHEICSDKKIDEFFNKLIVANKKYYPNYDLAFKILKQMIKDLEASAN